MIKMQRILPDLNQIHNYNYMDFIEHKEYRLQRRNFLPDASFSFNTLWLDDMYMEFPTCTNGDLHRGKALLDEAVRQILQFSKRMFVEEKGLHARMGRRRKHLIRLSIGDVPMDGHY